MAESKDMEPCDDACACHTLPRRDFLRLGGVAATGIALGSLPLGLEAAARRFRAPARPEKGLTPEWLRQNLGRGVRETYSGGDLRFIGMPVGGICAGEVLVGGDGQLWLWDIFNHTKFGLIDNRTVQYAGQSLNAGSGANYVDSPLQTHPFAQGFAVEIETADGPVVKRMDFSGWKEISFTGEYPIGFNRYRDPVTALEVDLESLSPYIPLESESSGRPAVVQRFTFKNPTQAPLRLRFGGWLENAICLRSISKTDGWTENSYHRDSHLASIECSMKLAKAGVKTRPDVEFEDFEKATYEGWTVLGTAFGVGPIEMAKMPSYQGDVGGHGKRVACSFDARNGESIEQGDNKKGKLISRKFAVGRRFIGFLIGGGNHPGTCCMNLVVDEKVVRSATGKDREQLERASFEVAEFEGRQAHLEIVDDQDGGWGHVTIDDIGFSDEDPALVSILDRADFGTMALSLLNPSSRVTHRHDLSADHPAQFLFLNSKSDGATASAAAPARLTSGLIESLELGPGESRTLSFVWSWHFPNLSLARIGAVKNRYSVLYKDARQVAEALYKEFEELYKATRLWHSTWYDSTLPYWLLDRVMGNNATLATMTSVRFANGRFYGWEGIGCCDGTCGHVWAYAQGPARLFPDLERSVREMVDFGVAFHEDTGIIDFRGEYGEGYATDAQGGYVLRAYREHQMSKDAEFLRRNYPRVKKALQYLIEQDGDGDGIIENWQHNTLDVDLIGASSWLSSIYLSALRAGKEMATEMGDAPFAEQCQKIADLGTKNLSDRLWNGEYFVQVLDYEKNPDALRYGDGCEIDQVMGQWWSWQLGLDRVIEAGKTKAALQALYKYNFLTDVGPFREKETAGRWYALPGEAGLLMCTFPKGDRQKILGNKPVWASGYFNECMSGFEYEAAAHMISEGLVEEGMAVTRAVHDRYHPSKRNPWNEVECSDHYARCMAVHSVYMAICGFEFHGPKRHIGFAPQVSPEKFRAAFTASEGWGTYEQKLDGTAFTAKLTPTHGRVEIKTFGLDIPAGVGETVQVRLGEEKIEAELERVAGTKRVVRFDKAVIVCAGQALDIRVA